MGSNSRVCPIVPAGICVLEVVKTTLDCLHLDHELNDMFAVSWAYLALLGVVLEAILPPRVPGPAAWTARRLLSCCRCSR